MRSPPFRQERLSHNARQAQPCSLPDKEFLCFPRAVVACTPQDRQGFSHTGFPDMQKTLKTVWASIPLWGRT